MRARAQNAVSEPHASSFDADLELKQLVRALGVDVDTLVGRPDVETVVRDRESRLQLALASVPQEARSIVRAALVFGWLQALAIVFAEARREGHRVVSRVEALSADVPLLTNPQPAALRIMADFLEAAEVVRTTPRAADSVH